ncbi:putative transporter like protein [Verticillium longisporum]|uniref:Putative transporter like protein n=1 Tax=Verticillium longisporum TaxID=100787 RepID=A0A8I2ZWX4_VERLO|nr:putative transporter like protein [Verticillium longisporum]
MAVKSRQPSGSRSPDPDGHDGQEPLMPADFVDERAPPDGFADTSDKQTTGGEARFIVTAQDNARVLRRIDLYVLPLMLAVYFLQSLDKTTLAYASVFGLIEDTGLQGDEYSWLGSVVYVAQLVMQFPLAWLLVKMPLGRFTGCMVALWGATLAAMAAARSFRSLLVARFLLGAFEASVAPSFIALTQMFWRRREQPLRMSFWYAMNGFTAMFGSLMTWGLARIPSTLRPYQVIFLFFGLVTVAFAVVMFRCMPDAPADARFLTPRDRRVAVERLRASQAGASSSRQWRWAHVHETIRDPKTWLWFGLIFSISVPSGGVGSFGPLIIESFGFDPFTAILFNAPFGLVQLVSTVGGALVAQRLRRKGPVIAALCVAPIAGCYVLMTTPRSPERKATLLLGYYLISVYPGMIPLMYSWSAANTAGDTKRKCNASAMFVGQSLGNIIGPLLYRPAEAPEYYRGLWWNLVLYLAVVGLVGVTSAHVAALNGRHALTRVKMGKPAVVRDRSLEEEDGEEGEVGARALDDATDLENEDFVFVY